MNYLRKYFENFLSPAHIKKQKAFYKKYDRLLKKKNAGMVEIRLQIIYLFSSCFWLAYAIMIDAWALKIVVPVYIGLLALTVILWKKYQVKPVSGLS